MNKPEAIPGRPRGLVPIAPEGWPFLGGAALALAICLWLGWGAAAIVVAILLAFMLNFFRDHERPTPQGEGLFIAPADGKVVRCEERDGVLHIDIFMNVFNVHVNRAPMAGRITDMRYTPGRFVNASFESASHENERNRFEMETDDGHRIAFTQIAGLVARRIVAYVGVGDRVAAGQRIGMIRFGSRVNCELPAAAFAPRVKTGDKVTAGRTVLAATGEAEAS